MTDRQISTEPVEMSLGARGLADLAYIETQGSSATRVDAAIRAYLWACREAKPFGDSGDLTVYPSLNELRAFLAAEHLRNT